VPQVNATGSAAEQQVSENGQLPVRNIPGFQRQYSLFDVGLDASWEIDLWGGVARSVQSSDARAQAAAIRAEDTRLRVVAEVVRTYVDLRSAEARGDLLGQEAQLREQIAQLVDQRYRGGESSRSDAETARQRADSARAQLPESDASAHAAAYSLALLTGRPPEALAAMATRTAPLPAPPAMVAAGIRSELLQRRPDVRAAEADLVAATADVGTETANLYPRFALAGNVGQQARNLGDVAEGGSTRFGIGPSFSWPIFSFGRIRAQIRAAGARADASAAAYEKTVLGALADSETAANRYAASTSARDARERALAEARAAAALAEQRFQRGEDDRIQMLEARSAALEAELSALAARADAAAAYVGFTKALGGGVKPAS
jgi:NodT family efflux transporter outer membrane factor (OMF) lipoprotein